MKKIISLIFFTILSTVSFSQFSWQNPSITGEEFNKIYFQSPTLGWVVGNAGTILNTTDGGNTWVHQNIGACVDITSIQFVNENEGWALGGGILFHSFDAGQSWTKQQVLSFKTITSLCFISSQIGWVRTEGGLFFTDNGGASWVLKYNVVSDNFCFANPRKGWQTTPFGGVKYTSDGGVTWVTQTTGVSENILCISVVDSNEVWMSGVSGLIHTTNGGVNWVMNTSSKVAIGSSLPFISNFHFSNLTTGWAISPNYEALITTSDGGLTWTKKSIKGNLVHCFDANNGLIVGNGLYKTTDGANTLINKISNVSDVELRSVHFANLTNGWAVGTAGSILHTSTSGSNWEVQNVGTKADLNSVFTLSVNEAWVAGNMNDTILHTINSGVTWQKQSSSIVEKINKLFFINTNVGWAVADSGKIIHTNNGGAQWGVQSTPTRKCLQSVYFVNANNGWAIGDDGLILFTTNAGTTWNLQASGVDVTLKDVFCVSPNEGWIVGDVSTILHTIDGGITWNIQTIDGLGDLFMLNSVCFIDSNIGWTTGFAPALFYTTNGGNTWKPYECATTNKLINSIYFADAYNGWIVGQNGAILYTNTGGNILSVPAVKNNENTINIYPNPANNLISINQTSSFNFKKDNYTIQIIDVLGQLKIMEKISINEQQINISELNGGIYYLKLFKNNQPVEVEKFVKF